jgi:hypothetical protein
MKIAGYGCNTNVPDDGIKEPQLYHKQSMTELPKELQDFNLLIESSKQFTSNFERKFSEGMRKYKTPLAHKNCTNEALQEVYDLYAYMFAQKQINANLATRAQRMLDTIAVTPEVRSFCEDVVFHLGKKPLAQKIKSEEPKEWPFKLLNPTEAPATASASSPPTEGIVLSPALPPFHAPLSSGGTECISPTQVCSLPTDQSPPRAE